MKDRINHRSSIRHVWLGLCVALAVCSVATVCAQTSVTLANPGFELPGNVKISGGFDASTNDVPGWANAGTTYVNSGVQLTPRSGAWSAFGNSAEGGAYQISSYPMNVGDQFALTWWANRGGSSASQIVRLLRATATNTAYASTTSLATNADIVSDVGTVFTQFTLNYNATAADAGKFIGIFFNATTGFVRFDDLSLTKNIAGAVTAPTVTNLPATSVFAAFATLNGQVLTTGNEPPTVRIYYGTNNGGANPAAWTNQIFLGAQPGNFSAQVAGLSANTTYYFTASASNSAGSAWGGTAKTFTTLAVTRVPVLTFHYDNTRQGQNTNETLLTHANVNTANFGKLFSYPVDSYVYAQPLVMNNLNIPGKGVRNVVFVATMRNSVYAFDADSNTDANGGVLWNNHLGTFAVSPSPEYGARYHSQGNTDVQPEEGATGTPVIDPASGTIYLDAFTREVVAGVSTNYFHRIHALNVTNGNEQPYSPVVVAASVPGTGVGGNGSVVTFAAKQHMQRPAMTLAGGMLYVGFGSHADTDPYHGWVLGYNAANLALSTNYIFNTTPNANSPAFPASAFPGEGALWMGGSGLVVDANTNLYFETANGSFSQNTNGGDYGSSFVKLSTTTNKLSVADYFTPFNQAGQQSSDADLGSGGPILLPDSVGSVPHPHLLVGAGKEGKIYLLDCDNLGRYNPNSDNQIVQSTANSVIGGGGSYNGSYAAPAYFNNRIYYTARGDYVRAFTISNGVLGATYETRSTTQFGDHVGSPVVSANGTANGIVWALDPTAVNSSGAFILHAYNATNLALELYSSSQNFARDNPGGAVKMTAPVVTGGKVYVGAEYTLSVFGPAIFLPAPTISPAGAAFTNSIFVTLADATAGAAIYYTLDGTPPTASSLLYTNPFTLTNSALVQAIAVASGAVNSSVTGAAFVNTAAAGSGTGLKGEYFANHTSASPFTGAPVLVQTNAPINFNWGTNGPDPLVGKTNFTVRWTGCVQPQFTENYSLITAADDGVRLFINGQLLIDDWTDKTTATLRTNTISLVAQQFYNLELDYYQKTNNASVALSWSSPSTSKTIILQTQLYPFTNPPPFVALTAPTNSAANFTAVASVTISADADAPRNRVGEVDFYANATFLGSVTNIPYTITATGLAAGNYALTAVAIDGSGLSRTSAPVAITVASGSGQPYGLTARNPAPAFFNMPTTFNGALPALLSQTGIFSNTPSMTLSNNFIPYQPNTPLWSDAALKTRYMAVPFSAGVVTPDEQINFTTNGEWTFPSGTIFVKTFELVTDETNPNVKRRLETRLLVRDINGAVYGVTYKWRTNNLDADLLAGSLNEDILITNATGVRTQTWYYPSPADCLTCHTPPAHYVLGASTRQLNGNFTYAATGNTDNQLRTLNRMGYFNPAINEADISTFSKLSSLTNAGASLEQRARSYLDANCAQCHRPGGTGTTFDARYDTPLANQHLTNYPAGNSLGYDNAKIIAPRDLWRSMIYQRMNTTNGYKMPMLARNLVDTNAVQVMTDWINSLPGIAALAPPTITPNGGAFFSTVNVAVQAPDPNAAIYFTLDGSLPTTNSLLYPGTLTLTNSATLNASAFRSGYNNSVVASALFTVQPVYFTSVSFLTNRQFQLGFIGVTGSNYVLQGTTNFSNWIPISTNTALTNLFNLVDPMATNFPYRFYRVLQP